MRFSWRWFAGATILMTGCSMAPVATKSPVTNPSPTPATQGTPFKGVVHGGQNPIAGASVYLFAMSTSGYGQASTSLLLSTGDTHLGPYGYYVTTGGDGSFSIAAGDYSCTVGQEVYLYSLGGNPQVAGVNKVQPAAGLLAVLGACGAGSTFSGLPSFVKVNEVTTVATAYALAGFATDATDISSGSSTLAKKGLVNAALNAANLADLGTGMALATTPNNNGQVPQSTINTLANVLAACINSATGLTMSDPDGPTCDVLLTNAENSNAVEPTDTATAAINIAQNPGANVITLFGLATPRNPFQPSLSNPPNDWTIAIEYTGGGLTAPTGIAADAVGNVWVTDSPTPTDGAVIIVGPQGNFLSNTAGYTCSGNLYYPSSLALGPSSSTPQTAWVASILQPSVNGVANDGTCTAVTAPTTSGVCTGFCDPVSLAANNDLFILDQTPYTLYAYNLSGTMLGEGPWQDFITPDAVAIDGGGRTWVTDSGTGGNTGQLYLLASTSDTAFTGPYSTGDLNDPVAIAIGASGSLWVADSANGAAVLFDNTGAEVVNNGAGNGGLNGPVAIAVDGAGNAWVADGASSISEFDQFGDTISPSGTGIGSGYTGGGYTGAGYLSVPTGIAIDPSGNVWVSDEGSHAVVEFIGAGVPAVTPLADAAVGNTIATKP